MKGAHSISTRRAYGVQRVCRVWHRARSSVYARRQATTSPCRRGPVGAAPDDVLVGHIGRMLEASPFHGEGYRKAWAKLRVEGIRTSQERVRRLMREHDLQAPHRVGHAHGPKAHDGTITTEAEEQQRFGEFVTFFDNAIQAARGWRMFKLAARRYLRAIRIAGFHPSSRDDYEDALLQYVFALEAIFLMGDTTAISDKLATRAAWLIGTDDRVRNETFTAVKDLYHARSSVVHGTTSKSRAVRSYELDGVRDLLRRSLVGLLAVRSAAESEDECIRLLKTAAFDCGSQSHIAGATEPVWRLIDSCPEWRRNGWGPKYEPYAPF